ncbi:MAG: hypothetical protein WA840_12745 [Caulobacteraceae bacterium]
MVSSVASPGTAPGPASPQTPSASTGAAAAPAGSSKPTTVSSPQAATSTPAVTVTISSNAQRLQAAEANLAADEAGSSTGALAAEWDQDLAGSVSILNEAAADAQVAALPSSDPAHLAQAQAAQTYVKARVTSGGNPDAYGANPFAGMSQSSLAAIINDKSGLYTDYEKSAAMYESQDQTTSWVMSQANDPQMERAAYFQEAQIQYNLLSPLQQSVYAPDYLKTMQEDESAQWNAPGKPNGISGIASQSPVESKGPVEPRRKPAAVNTEAASTDQTDPWSNDGAAGTNGASTSTGGAGSAILPGGAIDVLA